MRRGVVCLVLLGCAAGAQLAGHAVAVAVSFSVRCWCRGCGSGNGGGVGEGEDGRRYV